MSHTVPPLPDDGPRTSLVGQWSVSTGDAVQFPKIQGKRRQLTLSILLLMYRGVVCDIFRLVYGVRKLVISQANRSRALLMFMFDVE